jgi:MFS family permease
MRWVSAEGVSMVGRAITTVVLPLVVYEETGSATQTGLLFAFRVVPYLVFGLIAGPVADRGNRRALIIGGNLVEGGLVLTIPIAHALGVLTVAQVYAVACSRRRCSSSPTPPSSVPFRRSSVRDGCRRRTGCCRASRPEPRSSAPCSPG